MAVTADTILNIACAQIGTQATDVKKCKYNTWYYGSAVSGAGFDWCEVFVQWVFDQAGAGSLLYTKTANCGYAAKAFQDRRRLVTSGYRRGDVVFFHWSGARSTLVPGTYVSDHVGIIEGVNGDGTITTVEGNTGGGNGAVMRRVRSLSAVSCAGRPEYGDGEPAENTLPDICYRVRTAGVWLPEVNHLEDYAGIARREITDIAVRVSEGRVRYRVHLKNGGWLPYVSGCDISDDDNGYAGDKKAIDAVEIYYETPERIRRAFGWLKAKYRVAPLNGDYYPWQYDNEQTNGQDGYAGEPGRSIDRLQLTLSASL